MGKNVHIVRELAFSSEPKQTQQEQRNKPRQWNRGGNMRIRGLKTIVALGAIVGMLIAPQAKASLTFEFDTQWIGDTPTSTSPWLTAKFTTVGAGVVSLTLSSSLEVSSEFIDDIAFNIKPVSGDGGFLPSAVAIVQDLGPIATITKGDDNGQRVSGFNGPKSQGWDFKLSWPNHPRSARFDGSDVATFTLTAAGLTENDFKYLNDGADGFLYIAADVQGIPKAGGGTTSGGISGTVVPEASTLIAGALLLLPFGASTLRILRKKNVAG